ncbi:putative nuclear pore protein [Thozetella sp. PMI_491]|nr:putative nuclear pore protein [Thozetella sp. PMI_491]
MADKPEAAAATLSGSRNRNSIPLVPQDAARGASTAGQPLIPTRIIDAPTQRLYAAACWVALLAWRLYDWVRLVEDGSNTESFWLFLKWAAIDFVFIFGLPEMRIPWLEFSRPFAIANFFVHLFLNMMLMFNIGLPWQTWLVGFLKVFYDRELAISEHNVKLSSILYNHSLIMGRQVINILPEGSAALNPDGTPFCIGGDRKTVAVPLFFNATIPIEVELVRMDLDSGQHEILKLSRSQLREIERRSKRQTPDDSQAVIQFDYPVKKPGAYRLGKVLDEYKLEVQRDYPPTFVVSCPQARVASSPSADRCLGELSDLVLLVEGTPPLKIEYSRTINNKDRSFHFQSLQPEGFTSPILGHMTTLAVANNDDISWARSQQVRVGLNESMHTGGHWQYSVDAVHDAFGNVVKYPSPADDPEMKPKPKHLVQNFVVKERPRVSVQGCDLRNPLKVAKGNSKELPVVFEIAGRTPDDTSHSLTWQFSPIDTLTKSGDHGEDVTVMSYQAKNARDRPKISAPGLYTLKSVASGTCEGDVQEPSSCLLLNPLEPKLTIRAEEIPDTCAGNSIGLRVDMDLIGTPPFIVEYDITSNGATRTERVRVPGVRYQLELIPHTSGDHTYKFHHIQDTVYMSQELTGPEYVLEQNVKPAASAFIQHSSGKPSACLEEEIEIDVMLLGEAPFTLEWEIVHDGKRKQQKATGIQETTYKIKTAPMTQGGEHTVALTSVQDKRGCRNFLQDEFKVTVRRQRPRASFGLIDNKQKAVVVESANVKLPVRLSGEGPWKVSYRLVGDESKTVEKLIRNNNDHIVVTSRGTYELVDVYDNQCHGSVDPKTSKFEVDWFPRPELSLVPAESISERDGVFIKRDVCEGDMDGFEVSLKGSPPYHVEYQLTHKPANGPGLINKREFDAALGKALIQMETAKAGTYKYIFSSLADNLYNSDKKFRPLVLEQTVNAKPSVSFNKPGQSFKYCASEEAAEDKIPLTLVGVPPFALEVEIKHQSGSSPEIYRISSINSKSYSLQIPKKHLKLGTQQVRIREIRDARGCRSKLDVGGPSVQVQLYEAPSIYPLETRTDYCVGERISFTLSGTPPFEVWYTFDGAERKAKSPTTNFRRIAETPGEFKITTLSDKASECRASVGLSRNIHPLPAVKISKGKNSRVDIHEGGEVEILFEFWGTPPFEFTYTRSTNERKGQKSQVLETRHDVSYEHSKVIRASQEGTYEVVAIKDKFCAFSSQPFATKEKNQKLLQY